MVLKDYDILESNEIFLQLISKSEGNEAKGFSPEFKFDIKLKNGCKRIGHINLRLGNSEKVIKYIGHIGYGIDQEYRGNKYASKACKVAQKIFIDHNMSKVIVTCNPENFASRKVCESIGAILINEVEVPPTSIAYSETEKRKCRYEWVLK